MIKTLLSLFLMAFLFSSCAKEEKTSLIGVWITDSGEFLQYTITNTDGIGDKINFKKQRDSLFFYHFGELERFKIESLSASNLQLSAQNRRFSFKKVQ